MFNNIENKIMGSAIMILILGWLGSVIGAIVLWAKEMTGYGFLVLIIGGLGTLVFSWVLYGFGLLIEKTNEAAYYSEESSRELKRIRKAIEKNPEEDKSASVK